VRRWGLSVALCGLAAAGELSAADIGRPPLDIVFCCRSDNDLYRVLTACGVHCVRRDTPWDAVRAAPEGSGVLILADGYPGQTTVVESAVFDAAVGKKLRLYVEFPAQLPDLAVGLPTEAKNERGVITSKIFGDRLPPMQIVAINGCRYVRMAAASGSGAGTGGPGQSQPSFPEQSHMVLAKVAGVDTAVYGLDNTPSVPVLFDHPRGDLLVVTTKLSHFVSGRYMPFDAWRTIWQRILGRLQPGAPPIALHWTSTVRPSYRSDEQLPADAEQQAVRRSADWITRSRILRHPAWPQ